MVIGLPLSVEIHWRWKCKHSSVEVSPEFQQCGNPQPYPLSSNLQPYPLSSKPFTQAGIALQHGMKWDYDQYRTEVNGLAELIGWENIWRPLMQFPWISAVATSEGKQQLCRHQALNTQLSANELFAANTRAILFCSLGLFQVFLLLFEAISCLICTTHFLLWRVWVTHLWLCWAEMGRRFHCSLGKSLVVAVRPVWLSWRLVSRYQVAVRSHHVERGNIYEDTECVWCRDIDSVCHIIHNKYTVLYRCSMNKMMLI